MRLFSPAKVNLLLAVTGKREDGFHELVSLVSPVNFGDFLTISLSDQAGEIALSCTNAEVPVGECNLVVRAAKAFLDRQSIKQGLSIHLEKHIPMEAGLGGGSSNASTTLLLLNELFGKPLSLFELTEMAAQLGSDCPLFLRKEPVLMRGRGETIEELSPSVLKNLSGREIALFKPWIGISTAWAYQSLASSDGTYAQSEEVESRLRDWKAGKLPLNQLMFNSFEDPVFRKFPAFPALFSQIEEELGLKCLLSGSGSACLVLLDDPEKKVKLHGIVKEALGDEVFFQMCKLGQDNR
jgi:4-diphosphocytidyl-2-C-methyl-D-erythritol kinase